MLEVEKKIFRDEENAEKIMRNISREKMDKNFRLKNIVNSEVLLIIKFVVLINIYEKFSDY